MTNDDRSIAALQVQLPWGAHDYNKEFQECRRAGRDFEHAVLHIMKATGKLAGVADEFEHMPLVSWASTSELATARKALADIVICALRAANTYPGIVIDLESAVRDRLAEKFPKGGAM